MLPFTLILCFVSCTRVIDLRDEAQIKTNIEPGKCYHSLHVDGSSGFELIEHLLVTINKASLSSEKVTYSKEDLIKLETWDGANKIEIGEPIKDENGLIQILSAPAYLNLKFLNLDEIDDFKHKKETGYFFCNIEVPPRFRLIELDTLRDSSISYEIFHIEEKASITREILKTKPRKISSNQLYFNNVRLTKEREFVAYSRGYEHPLIKNIQNALNKNGYDLKVTNFLNDETKEAIIDYQKQHSLEIGQITYELLKKLGIE